MASEMLNVDPFGDGSGLPLYALPPRRRGLPLGQWALAALLLGLVAAWLTVPRTSTTTHALLTGQPPVTWPHATTVPAPAPPAVPRGPGRGRGASSSSSSSSSSFSSWGPRSVPRAAPPPPGSPPAGPSAPGPGPWRTLLAALLGVGLLTALLRRARARTPPQRVRWAAAAVGASAAAGAGPLAGKVVVFAGRFTGSGYKKADLVQLAEAGGAVVRGAASGQTDLLVTGSAPPAKTMEKAAELGIDVCTLAQFLETAEGLAAEEEDVEVGLEASHVPEKAEEDESEVDMDETEMPDSDAAEPLRPARADAAPAPRGFRPQRFTGDEYIPEFRGRRVVFTGAMAMTKHEQTYKTGLLGARKVDRVEVGANLVVVGKRPGRALQKAKRRGIEIVSEAQFMRALEAEGIRPTEFVLAGKRLAFAGWLLVNKAVAFRLAERCGATVTEEVDEDTDVLVSGKDARLQEDVVRRARQLGCEIWTESDFLRVTYIPEE